MESGKMYMYLLTLSLVGESSHDSIGLVLCLYKVKNSMPDVILMSAEEKCKSNLNIYFIHVNHYMWSLHRASICFSQSYKKKLMANFAPLRWQWFMCARSIGHFRVLLCLCFKTSLSAKPFIWKWVLHAVSFSCLQISHFHKNWFRT